MRISTRLFQDVGVNSLVKRQDELSDTQLRLATGRKILTPADDPVAAALALNIRQSVDVTEQFRVNGEIAKNRLGLAETTLDGVVNNLQRVRELAVQGLSDTYDARNRGAISQEVRERLDELLSLANTKDANGEYIFAGFQGRTQPFEQLAPGTFRYNGDQGERSLKVGPDSEVPVSDSGLDVFMKIPAAAGGVRDVFATVAQFATSLDTNAPDPNILTDLDAALDNILSVQASIGARENVVSGQQEVQSGVKLQLETTLSQLEDLDYAKAISDLNLQQVGLQAAQQSYLRVQNLSLFNFLN